jgi:hypothetical protein
MVLANQQTDFNSLSNARKHRKVIPKIFPQTDKCVGLVRTAGLEPARLCSEFGGVTKQRSPLLLLDVLAQVGSAPTLPRLLVGDDSHCCDAQMYIAPRKSLIRIFYMILRDDYDPSHLEKCVVCKELAAHWAKGGSVCALCGMTRVDGAFQERDYFDLIMRAGRPASRALRRPLWPRRRSRQARHS